MGRIRILSDQVANQIAAGEVVDRPASVVKELLENALDAGAGRIRVEVEGGGRKLIRVSDDGHGMSRDDALLAFERHATSKLRTVDDLLSIATLGFRGEALPSIASVARVKLETSTGDLSSGDSGTSIEIAGGKILRVEEAGLPRGTTLEVADLFFNTPARRKFLRAESTELTHVAALVTHYALVHPERHFELVSATQTLVSAPPVAQTSERIYQIFGKETLNQLLPVASELPLERAGLPAPPPWKRDPEQPDPDPGRLRLSGFYSKPELQKLNRNSMYFFVNKRLIRDRVLLHAVLEAYRNVIPPTSFPVVLLFLEMPPEEVDVNVHPAKTEVRFRQQSLVHDFVRDQLRTALVKARPAAGFLAALDSQPTASPSLNPLAAIFPSNSSRSPLTSDSESQAAESAGNAAEPFELAADRTVPVAGKLPFTGFGDPSQSRGPGAWGEAVAAFLEPARPSNLKDSASTGTSGLDAARDEVWVASETAQVTLHQLGSLKPLGQLRESFILATGSDGLWIIDQHVAHERILFERILTESKAQKVPSQRLLMPLLVELKPEQMVIFARIADELEHNGFEVEPFGPRTLAVKAAPMGLEGVALERTLSQVIDETSEAGEEPQPSEELTALRRRIAASVACHAAIKVNTALDPARMEWLLLELAKTSHPTSCPHGRPIALLYSWREIERAFRRV
jgi:DNA mismatch repair protein MutL